MGDRGPFRGVRVLLAAAAGQGERVSLSAEEGHHVRVRRAATGDRVELRDGRGFIGIGVLGTGGATGWEVLVEAVERSPEPAATVLAVAAGDRDRFAWLVEKAAELGVTRIVPVETERTRSVAGRVTPAQRERLERRALESVKQSGAAWAPRVSEITALDEWLAEPLAGERLVADRSGAAPPPLPPGRELAVLIGPEGGFTEGEYDAIRRSGWRPARFGAHTLRFETAALAAAAWAALERPGEAG